MLTAVTSPTLIRVKQIAQAAPIDNRVSSRTICKMPEPALHGPANHARVAIGIFDSGLGGLSVLRALRSVLPAVPMTYIADSAYAPYGERPAEEVCERSLLIAGTLLRQGARLLVVACNTATAAAIPLLRERWPDVPIVGVEPGLKPALRVSRNARIGVMATEGTLHSARFQALMQREVTAAERLLHRPISVFLQACPGLAALIETADLASEGLRAMLARCCEPLRRAEVDTVVLGCTHYPFVAHLIQHELGNAVQLVDTAEAVARQVSVRWATAAASSPADRDAIPVTAAGARYFSSGDVERLRYAASRWLGEPMPEVGWCRETAAGLACGMDQ